MSSPKKMKRAFALAKEKIKLYKKQIKTLKQQSRRMKRKINSLKDVLDEIKKKSLITDSASNVLEVSICLFNY